MSLAIELQPDQQPEQWNRHVEVYEAVFEPLSNAFAQCALDLLALRPGDRLIDIGAGCGGATLLAAGRGADVLAIDTSARMVERVRERAQSLAASRIEAEAMDGMALTLADCSFDAAVSVFGVILFPDAPQGLREIARVLKPGGRAAIVTWTESERYELVGRLVAAIAKVRGPLPAPQSVPAQLRFRDPPAFRDLLTGAGLAVDQITRVEERWRLPSARWLADRLAFAPGMSAMVGSFEAQRDAVLEAFVSAIEADQGPGEISLCAVAQIGLAMKPALSSRP